MRIHLSLAAALLLSQGCVPPQERLEKAVLAGSTEEAEKALKDGADPSPVLGTALANLGSDKLVPLLVARGADPNRPLSDGSLPLESAVATSHGDHRRAMVKALLDAGADPNRPARRVPPLLWALSEAQGYDEATALLLIEKKADPNVRWQGKLALDLALGVTCRRPPKLVEALLAAGARPEQSAGLPIALSLGASDSFDLLLEKGAALDAVCPEEGLRSATTDGKRACAGLTALALAAQYGDLETLTRLLDKGASVDAPEGGTRPLHAAARAGRTEAVRRLLARKANPLALDADRATALHGAATSEIVRLLLAAKVPVDAPDKDGDTPLTWALSQDLRDPRPAETEAESRLAEEPRPVALALLAAGAAPDRPGSDKLRPLHRALASGDAATARSLLERKASAVSKGPGDPEPLLWLLEKERDIPDLAETLLGRGASPNAKDAAGESALVKAIRAGASGTAELLMDRGADLADALAVAGRTKVAMRVDAYGRPDPLGSWEERPSPDVAAAESPREKILAACRAKAQNAEAARKKTERHWGGSSGSGASDDRAREERDHARDQRRKAFDRCTGKGILAPRDLEECIRRSR